MYVCFIAPQDYLVTNRPFFIPRSFNSFRFFITINDDQILEENEQFSVSLQLPSDGLACGIALGVVTTATVNIIDNDGI